MVLRVNQSHISSASSLIDFHTNFGTHEFDTQILLSNINIVDSLPTWYSINCLFSPLLFRCHYEEWAFVSHSETFLSINTFYFFFSFLFYSLLPEKETSANFCKPPAPENDTLMPAKIKFREPGKLTPTKKITHEKITNGSVHELTKRTIITLF